MILLEFLDKRTEEAQKNIMDHCAEYGVLGVFKLFEDASERSQESAQNPNSTSTSSAGIDEVEKCKYFMLYFKGECEKFGFQSFCTKELDDYIIEKNLQDTHRPDFEELQRLVS